MKRTHAENAKTACRRMMTALALLLALACVFPSASAEKAGKKNHWAYDAAAQTDSAVWDLLMEEDEAFYRGVAYRPLMFLGSDGETEAWLVTYGTPDEASSEALAADGYLVMYIQLTPAPKVIGTFPVGTAPEKTKPTCEIKLLIDPSLVLDEGHLLSESIREAFQMDETYQTIGFLYLDTPDLDYFKAGWNNRIRVKEGKARYTVTCKIRYAVSDEDLDAALNAARADGFSLFDPQFPAEVDWGYSGMTLSFAADMNVKTEETPDICLLDLADAVKMLAEQMPSEVKNWQTPGWGTACLESVRIYGPIQALRYTGDMDGQSVRIEIWPIPGEDGMQYITEFSTECEDVETAAGVRRECIDLLEEMGILLHEDGMKTKMVLQGIPPAEGK